MAIRVDSSTPTQDLAKVLLNAAKGVRALLSANPIGVYESVTAALAAAEEENPTLEQRAFYWFRRTVALALFDILRDPVIRSKLHQEEMERVVTAFLDKAFVTDGQHELTVAALIEPAGAPIYDAVRERFPQFLQEGVARART